MIGDCGRGDRVIDPGGVPSSRCVGQKCLLSIIVDHFLFFLHDSHLHSSRHREQKAQFSLTFIHSTFLTTFSFLPTMLPTKSFAQAASLMLLFAGCDAVSTQRRATTCNGFSEVRCFVHLRFSL